MGIGLKMATRTRTTWNGTPEEALALLHSLQTHCQCSMVGERIITCCEPQAMLARDQRAIDGLLFMRRIASKLLTEEFDPV